MLAARIRPAAVPLHELLYAMADTTAQKMQLLREAKEDALMTVCSTFANRPLAPGFCCT